MFGIHTDFRYDFSKSQSITERILLLAVTLGETDSARHVELVVGTKATTLYKLFMLSLLLLLFLLLSCL